MNRRNVLKALGALPIATAWAGCNDDGKPAPPTTTPAASAPPTYAPVRTLQILLEGPFAVVLNRRSRRLIAFIPRPEADKAALLGHEFYFNDPTTRQDLGTPQKPNDYHFALPQSGLADHSNP